MKNIRRIVLLLAAAFLLCSCQKTEKKMEKPSKAKEETISLLPEADKQRIIKEVLEKCRIEKEKMKLSDSVDDMIFEEKEPLKLFGPYEGSFTSAGKKEKLVIVEGVSSVHIEGWEHQYFAVYNETLEKIVSNVNLSRPDWASHWILKGKSKSYILYFWVKTGQNGMGFWSYENLSFDFWGNWKVEKILEGESRGIIGNGTTRETPLIPDFKDNKIICEGYDLIWNPDKEEFERAAKGK